MKTKVLAIFALAAILVACDNKNGEEPQNVPSNKVTLCVAVPSAQPNQVMPRNIIGVMDGNFGDYGAYIAWSWEGKEKLVVSGSDTNGQKFSKFFTFKRYEDGKAYFEGTLPDSFDQQNGTFDVSYSKATAPSKNQSLKIEGYISDGSMYFEAKECKLSDNVIDLYPQWSVLAIQVKTTNEVYLGDINNDPIPPADIETVTATLQKIKVYALTGEREIDLAFTPYEITLDYDEENRKIVGMTKEVSVYFPIVVFDKFEHGIKIEVTYANASLTLKGTSASKYRYPQPELTYSYNSTDDVIDFTILDEGTNTYPGKFITISPKIEWHRESIINTGN